MDTRFSRTVAVCLVAGWMAACSSSGGVTGGPTGGDTTGALPDLPKPVDVLKPVDIPKVDLNLADLPKPDVPKPDVQVVDVAKPDVALPDVPGQCTAAKNFCIDASTLQQCDPSTGGFSTVACTDAACSGAGQGTSIGCGPDSSGIAACRCSGKPTGCTAADTHCNFTTSLAQCNLQTGQIATIECTDGQCASVGQGKSLGCVTEFGGVAKCSCEGPSSCTTKCLNPGTLAICNPSTGQNFELSCTDQACQSAGKGVSTGCGTGADGGIGCQCSGGGPGNCTSASEFCDGNTLHFCDPVSGEMQTFPCTQADCTGAGLGTLIGCAKDQDGIFNCLCNP
jgi:hypothetical protein